jgi:hypothetical protein
MSNILSGKIILKTEFEKQVYLILSELSLKVERLQNTSVDSEMLHIILSATNDFNDFKKKYTKYLRIKNNNSKINNFIKKDLNINLELTIGNRVITKKNGKIGTLVESYNNNSNNISVKFNGNENISKVDPFKLKKYNGNNI